MRFLEIFFFRVALFFLVLFSAAAFAQEQPEPLTFMIAPALQLEMTVPAPVWEVSKTPPQYLVDETIEDVRKELRKTGKTGSDDQIKAQVNKRLSSNELYVFNPASKATLLVDFSPLTEGEAAPSPDNVKASATAAGESMASEEGMSNSRYRVTDAQVKGVETAYRLDLEFNANGEPRKFIGLIGFTQGNWIFLYFTDRLAVKTDYPQMEELLSSLVVRSVSGQISGGKEAFEHKDYGKALQIFSPLAEDGSAEALYYIGFMHMKGLGVPQDHKEAAEWYKKAAERGSVQAQNNLGFVFAKGDHGLNQDYAEAAKWFRMAAQNGEVAAQFNIGRMYLEGTGVAKDPIMAYAFLAWAAEGGDNNAGDYLERAEKTMTPAQIEQGKNELERLKNRSTKP